ncbi:MAG: ABC transporter ATP-binding protein [Kiritimatiellaeota bacterium]|nr:ABC transporter ATP-binding protein [Kiritimatiellota bacterium]
MIEARNIRLRLGEFVLDDVSLRVNRHEYFVLVGPTGAGKSVLLECLAGLLRPSSGRVLLDGEDVTGLPPEARRLGYVPQDYALFPHLNVRENLEFGLRVSGRDSEIATRVPALAKLLGVTHLLARSPVHLSGGEKQRVALGRALAIEPRVLLLDEPLAALDAATRRNIGSELRRIHDETGITCIHISHNFDEMIHLADRVALMSAGRILQVGCPADLLRRPACRFAAEFMQTENLLPGRATAVGGAGRVLVNGLELRAAVPCAGQVWVAVRADRIGPADNDAAADRDVNVFPADVASVEDVGAGFMVRTAGPPDLTFLATRPELVRHGIAAGRRIRLAIPPEDLHVFSDTPLPRGT